MLSEAEGLGDGEVMGGGTPFFPPHSPPFPQLVVSPRGQERDEGDRVRKVKNEVKEGDNCWERRVLVPPSLARGIPPPDPFGTVNFWAKQGGIWARAGVRSPPVFNGASIA